MTEKTDSENYPKLSKLGIPINREPEAPAGCRRDDVKAALEPLGMWDAFRDWIKGSTVAANGIYPDDVERFLEGRPNID